MKLGASERIWCLLKVIKNDESIVYIGYIYRHWIINDKLITKSYIGKTENKPEARWHFDGSGYKDSKEKELPTVFWNAICKYGWNNFNHDILLKIECTKEEDLKFWLNEWEKYYIWYYDSYYKNGNGYNMTLGGDGVSKGTEPWNKGKKDIYSEQTLQKMSESRKGKCIGVENGFYGRKHSESSKEQMSLSQKNLYENGYINPNLGLKRSNETKRKMSISQRKRMSEKENNPMYGKKHSEEAKKKISEAQKKNHKKQDGEDNPNARSVICLNNGQKFVTVKSAEKWCHGNVGKACKSGKNAGKHPETGEKLKWMYYDEYLKLEEKDDNENGKH